jgi:hypothetical protein
MKRLVMLVILLALPAMACNLTDAPTPIPTVAPPPVLQNPMVGLNPVSGAPGSIITIGAAGFPAGSKVNLSVAPVTTTTTTTGSTTPAVAQNLTIGAGGYLTFAYQLPNELNGTTIANNTPLNFTISSADNLSRANAIFIAVTGGAVATATTQSSDANAGSGGTLSGLYITSPAIGSTLIGTLVTVTGSGRAANNRVGVQVLDANYKPLGNAIATIQAAAGAVGPFEVTVSFTQPASPVPGYIVVYTTNAAGGVAEQASIPVTVAGGTVATVVPLATATKAPTVPPVITGGPTVAATIAPTTASTTSGFITATP